MTSAPYQYDCSSRLPVNSPTSAGSTGSAMPMPSTSTNTVTKMNGSAGRARGRIMGVRRRGPALGYSTR